MNLATDELTLDNVRNLSVSVSGVNEAPLLFDRTTLVNATVVYSVPDTFISLNPATATNEIFVDPDHTVTATIDTNGIPEPGVLVTFEIVSGPNVGEMSDPNSAECTPNNDCTTDINGEVSWTYSGDEIGTDTIVASFFNESIQTTIESNPVEKIWVLPPRNVPTLSQWGLIAMVSVLGIVGLIVMRRKKVVA